MRTSTLPVFAVLIVAALNLNCNKDFQANSPDHTNFITNDRTLIVMAAPSVNDTRYTDVFQQIVDFQVAFANKIIGNDNVVVVVDSSTLSYYQGRIPDDVILKGNIGDIWLRDFSSVNILSGVKFTYQPDYFDDESQATDIQNSFEDFCQLHGVTFKNSTEVLEGGNFISNGLDKVVVSERFAEDNGLSDDAAKQKIKDITGATEVAIVPYNENIMGHVDEMMAFADDNVIVLNSYSEPFRTSVIDALNKDLNDIQIVEIDDNSDNSKWNGIPSACGLYVNAVSTQSFIYLPTFGDHDDVSITQTVGNYTPFRQVIPVDVSGCCFMGGSVRNFTWELTGTDASNLIKDASND